MSWMELSECLVQPWPSSRNARCSLPTWLLLPTLQGLTGLFPALGPCPDLLGIIGPLLHLHLLLVYTPGFCPSTDQDLLERRDCICVCVF